MLSVTGGLIRFLQMAFSIWVQIIFSHYFAAFSILSFTKGFERLNRRLLRQHLLSSGCILWTTLISSLSITTIPFKWMWGKRPSLGNCCFSSLLAWFSKLWKAQTGQQSPEIYALSYFDRDLGLAGEKKTKTNLILRNFLAWAQIPARTTFPHQHKWDPSVGISLLLSMENIRSLRRGNTYLGSS